MPGGTCGPSRRLLPGSSIKPLGQHVALCAEAKERGCKQVEWLLGLECPLCPLRTELEWALHPAWIIPHLFPGQKPQVSWDGREMSSVETHLVPGAMTWPHWIITACWKGWWNPSLYMCELSDCSRTRSRAVLGSIQPQIVKWVGISAQWQSLVYRDECPLFSFSFLLTFSSSLFAVSKFLLTWVFKNKHPVAWGGVQWGWERNGGQGRGKEFRSTGYKAPELTRITLALELLFPLMVETVSMPVQSSSALLV